jgi:uncharacterized protein
MRIWFNQVPLENTNTSMSQCDDPPPPERKRHSELYCEQIFNNNNDHSFLNQECSCISNNEVIQQAAALYIQPLSPGKTLVCNPTGSGRIAVLDQDALTLLEQIHTPVSFYKVLSLYPEKQSESVRSMIATFYHLGFLAGTQCAPDPEGTSSTLSAWLHVTNACNLSCDYCYIGKSSQHMSDDTSRRAIDAILRSAVKHNYKQVRLRYAGGEASLRAENVLSIHDYAVTQAQQHNLDLHAFILSNGVFLSKNTIAAFKARNIGVTLSLDGIGAEHDQQRPFISGRSSFKLVERTITQLLAYDLAPHITVTVSQRNLSGLPALMEYLLERNLSFSFNYYRANAYSMQQKDLQFAEMEMIEAMRSAFRVIEKHLPQRSLLNSLLDKASLQSTHQHACGAGHNYIVIDQQGGVAKCHAAIQQTVTTIDAPDPLQLLREDRAGVQFYAADEKEGCRDCNWRYWCSGGCPTLTYHLTGRSDVKSPNCNIYTALFPDVLRLEALRLLAHTSPITF